MHARWDAVAFSCRGADGNVGELRLSSRFNKKNNDEDNDVDVSCYRIGIQLTNHKVQMSQLSGASCLQLFNCPLTLSAPGPIMRPDEMSLDVQLPLLGVNGVGWQLQRSTVY